MSENNSNRDQTYHYFTYGRVPSEREAKEKSAQPANWQAQPSDSLQDVEITPPRELRAYPSVRPSEERGGGSSWSYSAGEKKRPSTFRSVVLSFLAGAVVVGSLMFASDYFNLFTGSQPIAADVASSGAVTASSSGGSSSGGVTTANMEIVRPNTIADLAEMASPAVVLIETYSKQRTSGQYRDFFDYFFGIPSQPVPQQESSPLVRTGTGSGFFFDKEGYILTNEHVINGAEEVRVIVQGQKEPYIAEVLGTAYNLDLAVLKIKGDKDFPTLPLGNSDQIRVGDWVVAIGNPYEFDHTVTVGVLSAKERAISIPDSDGTRHYEALLQTDASINPGNSGGPLLNLAGEVIGINTAVNAQAQGIGFAIPTSTILSVLDSLKANEEVPIPYIGIQMTDVPEEYVEDLGLESSKGAFVADVMFRSPAHEAGLQKYDVIVRMDGKDIHTSSDVQKIVRSKKPGESLAVDVIRNGRPVTLTVTVGDRNEAQRQ